MNELSLPAKAARLYPTWHQNGEEPLTLNVQSGDKVAPPQPPRKKHILLVDDDAAVRESLAGVLESANYHVVLAESADQALEGFATHPPDLVLLDLNMPDKDGWATFADMEERQPLLPVIVITARTNQYQRAVGAGIDALMEKPLDLPLLLQAIENLLREAPQERLARLVARDFATAYFNHSAIGAPRPELLLP